MTRAETLEAYNVDEYGVIRSLGKFEGEMIYLPHFYSVFLDGGGEDNGKRIRVDITEEDRREYPELGKVKKVVKFYEREDGFVIEC
jgi:hypothetical protein